MLNCVKKFLGLAIPALVIMSMFGGQGCDGSDTKQKITRTVDQAVGGDVVRKGKQIEQDVNQSMKKEMEQARKNINTATDTTEPQGTENASPK
jgi:hypothetical protein